ncbi:enoyl-CoA hydratase-related protein [Nocardioides jishulii]|uniref:Enoyl-CoA hydratase n=1 Tax=Nocardioides jishulii TaxID=2575440 RepID=A0A4U2YU86_9ACTN|nr:enoyl-CoA hydratase-related protein [Nocardioides jishulii]QCX26503.1 enoyl-CoA hydratase [Nocardioides jishulii]TKI63691.1 enoyl-CoA hydratase [Nocardioides jishulii]
MSDSELLVTSADGVVTVVFNRPQRHNAFTKAMYAEMRALFEDLATRPDVRVVVLRGAGGRAFAAGNDIGDFLDEDDASAYEEWIGEMLAALFDLPQVTIAAIDGVCVGGGLAVATHCDIRIATPESRFGYPIAKTLGNALSAPVLYRCAAAFGEGVTRTMLLTGRLVDAERAYDVGALTEVTEDLNASIDALVGEITFASATTQRASKRQLNAQVRANEVQPDFDRPMLGDVYSGPDFKEGVRAFLAKEKPSFGRG